MAGFYHTSRFHTAWVTFGFHGIAVGGRDLVAVVEIIRKRAARIRSLAEDIDTTTPSGRLILHVFGFIAVFERERGIERSQEGLTLSRGSSER